MCGIQSGWDRMGRGMHRRALRLRQENRIKSQVSCFSDLLDLIWHVMVVLWEEKPEVTCDLMTKAQLDGFKVTMPKLKLIHMI